MIRFSTSSCVIRSISYHAGITNQRETTLCWSRSTGKPLCNAIVWDDARTNGVVRDFEKKLDEEGIDIDEVDDFIEVKAEVPNTKGDGDAGRAPPLGEVGIGTGTSEAAFGNMGTVENGNAGIMGAVGQAMETLGLAGRGKDAMGGGAKKKRKGKESLVDV